MKITEYSIDKPVLYNLRNTLNTKDSYLIRIYKSVKNLSVLRVLKSISLFSQLSLLILKRNVIITIANSNFNIKSGQLSLGIFDTVVKAKKRPIYNSTRFFNDRRFRFRRAGNKLIFQKIFIFISRFYTMLCRNNQLLIAIRSEKGRLGYYRKYKCHLEHILDIHESSLSSNRWRILLFILSNHVFGLIKNLSVSYKESITSNRLIRILCKRSKLSIMARRKILFYINICMFKLLHRLLSRNFDRRTLLWAGNMKIFFSTATTDNIEPSFSSLTFWKLFIKFRSDTKLNLSKFKRKLVSDSYERKVRIFRIRKFLLERIKMMFSKWISKLRRYLYPKHAKWRVKRQKRVVYTRDAGRDNYEFPSSREYRNSRLSIR